MLALFLSNIKVLKNNYILPIKVKIATCNVSRPRHAHTKRIILWSMFLSIKKNQDYFLIKLLRNNLYFHNNNIKLSLAEIWTERSQLLENYSGIQLNWKAIHFPKSRQCTQHHFVQANQPCRRSGRVSNVPHRCQLIC